LVGHQIEEVRTRQHRLLEQGFTQHPRHPVSVRERELGHLGSRSNDLIGTLVACGRRVLVYEGRVEASRADTQHWHRSSCSGNAVIACAMFWTSRG
jgi:hypothetical protein